MVCASCREYETWPERRNKRYKKEKKEEEEMERRRDRIEDEEEKEKKEEMTMKKEWNQVHEMRKKYRTHLKGVLLAYIKMW